MSHFPELHCVCAAAKKTLSSGNGQRKTKGLDGFQQLGGFRSIVNQKVCEWNMDKLFNASICLRHFPAMSFYFFHESFSKSKMWNEGPINALGWLTEKIISNSLKIRNNNSHLEVIEWEHAPILAALWGTAVLRTKDEHQHANTPMETTLPCWGWTGAVTARCVRISLILLRFFINQITVRERSDDFDL